uniref:Uncharacterized protein n=1 Tax=Glossina pallidipes TaxID=7398 RepID=A0A1B0A951_GLOPL
MYVVPYTSQMDTSMLDHSIILAPANMSSDLGKRINCHSGDDKVAKQRLFEKGREELFVSYTPENQGGQKFCNFTLWELVPHITNSYKGCRSIFILVGLAAEGRVSEICGTLDLDTKDTVEGMRKTVTAPITTPDLAAGMNVKLTELENRYAAKTLHLPEGTGRGASPTRYVQEQMSCGAAIDRICKWSVRQLFFGDTAGKELAELIILRERFKDIPAPTVLTKNCCRQNTRQHTEARGMTVNGSLERGKPPSDAARKIMKMVESTLAASLTVGGLPTTGIVDTGATRSIIRKDIIGFIPYILSSEARCNTIRMADGLSQRSKRSITVKVNVGDVSFALELLVVGRSIDHLTLGMYFLAKTGADMTIAGYPVKLGHQSGAHTTTAAAKKRACCLGRAGCYHLVTSSGFRRWRVGSGWPLVVGHWSLSAFWYLWLSAVTRPDRWPGSGGDNDDDTGANHTGDDAVCVVNAKIVSERNYTNERIVINPLNILLLMKAVYEDCFVVVVAVAVAQTATK